VDIGVQEVRVGNSKSGNAAVVTAGLRSVRGLALERFFAELRGKAEHLLCTSDIEPYGLGELLAEADPETLGLWHGLTLGYTEPSGHPLLRAEIAGLYANLEPENVLTFSGADEAIFLAFTALLRPGDHAVVTWPAYQSLHELARASGAEVTLLPLAPMDGWAFDVEALRKAVRPSTRAIVVNFPHNPTGALPSRETFAAIEAVAAEVGAVLVSDEVYRFLEHDSDDRLPPAADGGRRALSVGVMSKAFGLAGVRIGWVATRDRELLSRIATCKEYISSGTSAPSELLALVALRSRDRVLERSRALLVSNLEHLDEFFAEWEEVFEWVRPRAGCVCFPRLAQDLPVEELAVRLVREEGVLLVPGSVYDFPGNHFRLGFGRADFPQALERLHRFAARSLAGARA